MKKILIILTTVLPLTGLAETPTLDPSKENVKKFSTSASMIGTRNTLKFYTFEGQQAAMKVVIDNTSTKFPITATLYKFADDASDESLAKWVNNQHSDGLYVDAAKPTATYKVPADSCTIVSHDLMDRTKHHNGEHDNYTVKFRIGDLSEEGVFKLKAFTDTAQVHIKVPGK